MTHNKRILRARGSGVPVWDQLLSGRWALARRKSASRYAESFKTRQFVEAGPAQREYGDCLQHVLVPKP